MEAKCDKPASGVFPHRTGRPLGAKGRVAREIKEAILEAMRLIGEGNSDESELSGETRFFIRMYEDRPASFEKFILKLLPKAVEVKSEHRRLEAKATLEFLRNPDAIAGPSAAIEAPLDVIGEPLGDDRQDSTTVDITVAPTPPSA